MLALELENLAMPDARADTGKQGEREERDKAASVDLFDVVHELLGLLSAQGLGGAATVSDAVMGDFFDRIGGDPILLEREFEEGVEDAAPVVDGLGASVAVLAMVGELVGGQLRDEHGGKPLFENAEMAADVVELGNRKKLLIVLALLGGDVSRDRIDQGLLAIWSAVVGQGKIEVERKRLGRVGEAAERSLGLVKLGIGQPRGGGANAGLGLEALDFQGLTLGGGLGAGREILTDARTIEPTGDAKNDLLGGIREF